MPTYLEHPKFYDLCNEFTTWQGNHAAESSASGPVSHANMCAVLGLGPPKSSRSDASHISYGLDKAQSHKAIDDCRSVFDILRTLVEYSQPSDALFSTIADSGADFRAFVREESKVLHLSGLAPDTTQSELESWFTQHGGRPIAFWTLRTPEQHKPIGTGFAVFSSHGEAKNNLNMNGRALAERTIEVSPSSPRILDRAAEILTPFPVSHHHTNRPAMMSSSDTA